MNPRIHSFLFMFLGLPAAYLIFSPGLFSGYFADDFALLRSTSVLGDPGVESAFYRPVSMFVFWLFDRVLFNGDPFLSHIFSIVIHWMNAVLVYYATRSLFVGHSLNRPLSLASAALFLTYPQHTEAVIWMAARGDLLCSLFLLLSLVLVLKHWQGPAVDQNRRFSLYLLGAWFSFLLSLLSKEAGVVYFPILACVLYFLKDQRGLRLVAQLFPFALILTLYFLIRTGTLGHLGGYEQVYAPIRIIAVFFVQLIGLVLPGVFDFFRFGQSFVYSALLIVLALLSTCLISIGAWYLIRLSSTGGLMVISLVLSLIPPAGIFTLNYSANDRVLYIPSIWLCLGMSLLIFSFNHTDQTGRKRAVTLISGFFALISFVLSFNWYFAGQLRDKAAAVPTPVIELDRVRLAVVPHNYKGVYILVAGAGQYSPLTGATINSKGKNDISGLVLLNVEARSADFRKPVSMLRISSEEVIVTAGENFSFRATPGAYSMFRKIGLEATFDQWRGINLAKVLRLRTSRRAKNPATYP
jgi:hypothetical protein